jgi:MFS family permease
VFGTIGWIAASTAFPMIWDVEGSPAKLVESLRFSAGIAVVYATFCLFLPATPPRREGVEPLAFAKAFRLFDTPWKSFLVLVLASLPISVIHNVYFQQASKFLSARGLEDSQIGPAMAVGQWSEIVIMAALGWMLKRLGFRVVIAIGGLAYFVRYWIWSESTSLPVLVGSQALHGVCYACFFASAYIYVDRIAPPDVRHSAQTVFGILILGGGPVLGGVLSGYLEAADRKPDWPVDYSHLWRTVALIGLATALAFAALFRDETREIGSGESRDPS